MIREHNGEEAAVLGLHRARVSKMMEGGPELLVWGRAACVLTALCSMRGHTAAVPGNFIGLGLWGG